MRRPARGDRYDLGPTVCIAHPDVIASIQAEMKDAESFSPHEIQLLTMMGGVSADGAGFPGFNDGVIYPPQVGLGRAPSSMALPQPALSMPPAPQRSMHALALLVDFSDNVGNVPASHFQHLLFDATNPQSLTSYYHTLSGGRLTVTGDAIGYLRASNPYSYYTNGKSGTGLTYPNNTPGLLDDALNLFCQNHSLQAYDADNDGFVDGLFLIHAGGGAETEPDLAKRKDKIWSHKWTLPQPFLNGGVSVFAYSTEPEDGRVGVFCHEFGHVLGLPDLYDSTYRTKGVGNWCLMGGGSWGGSGHSPTRMSCWCLSKLGWILPQNVTVSGPRILPPLASDPNACLRVWSGGFVGPEYFLLENRQATGQDSALPGLGLAVWHIDENQQDNTRPRSYLVGLVQADGLSDLENNANAGDPRDLFPGSSLITAVNDATNPSTRAHNGLPTGVALSSIALSGSDVTLDVTV